MGNGTGLRGWTKQNDNYMRTRKLSLRHSNEGLKNRHASGRTRAIPERVVACTFAAPLSILDNYEGLGSHQGDSTPPFGKLPVSFPPGEQPTGGEGAYVGKGTELFVRDVYFYS
jgi:hypothetical protein